MTVMRYGFFFYSRNIKSVFFNLERFTFICLKSNDITNSYIVHFWIDIIYYKNTYVDCVRILSILIYSCND